jgi:hypothetical protein
MQYAATTAPEPAPAQAAQPPVQPRQLQPTPSGKRPIEIGGRPGPDPTRYGDWEKNGRCIDF